MSNRKHMQELGRQGGHAKAAKLRARKGRAEPYGEPFLGFLDATGRGGPTRALWRVFWKCADGLPLDPAPSTTGVDELALYRTHTGRQTPPTTPPAECWVVAGRRSGKSEQMVTRATWRAISQPWRTMLSRGEVATLPIVAPDREQARNSLGYLKGLVELPIVRPYVKRVMRDSVEFWTGAVVRILTASFKSTRGFTLGDAVLEESAFYASEGSANPDVELARALRPALLTVKGSRVYGISSPHARRGILYEAWKQHWAQESDVLVFVGSTRAFNPTADAEKIAREFEADPEAAQSEYGEGELVTFRSDVARLFDPGVVGGAVVAGRHELPRVSGLRYRVFVDPSGGSSDSFTAAVAHDERQEGRTVAVLDAIRERKPPFSPAQVVEEVAQLARAYGCSTVTGDKYAAQFVVELFAKAGVTYQHARFSKSEIYLECLGPLNSGRVALLDHPRLQLQLANLERRVARGTGREIVDHVPGQHDDVANSAAGAVWLALRDITDTVDATAFDAVNAEMRGRSAFAGYSPDLPSGGPGRERQSVYPLGGGGLFDAGGGAMHWPG